MIRKYKPFISLAGDIIKQKIEFGKGKKEKKETLLARPSGGTGTIADSQKGCGKTGAGYEKIVISERILLDMAFTV